MKIGRGRGEANHEWSNVTGVVAAHDSTAITISWDEGSTPEVYPVLWNDVRQVQVLEEGGFVKEVAILAFIVLIVLLLKESAENIIDLDWEED